MGWRSAVRTLGAIAREAERDSRRRAREQARHLAALEKVEQRERAEQAVRDFGAFVDSLIRMHRECSRTIDWDSRVAAVPPASPQWIPRREHAARKVREQFTPTLMTRLLGRTQRERDRLEREVSAARAKDDEEYLAASREYEAALAEHEDSVDLARQIQSRDPQAMLEFLHALNPFRSVAGLGENITMSVPNPDRVVLELNVYSDDVVPREVPRVLKSGRLSLKAMPKGDYFRLYQDYVCSAALRTALEALAALPVTAAVVTAIDDLVDPASGHLQPTPILSVLVPRATLGRLNLPATDPSDAMRNFLHHMDFRATQGFCAIERLGADAGAG